MGRLLTWQTSEVVVSLASLDDLIKVNLLAGHRLALSPAERGWLFHHKGINLSSFMLQEMDRVASTGPNNVHVARSA